MPSDYIPASWQRLWDAWNIRGCMILTVYIQLLLATLAPLRRKTSNPISIFLVWSTYLLADWTAVFAYGLITNSGCRGQSPQVAGDYLALWAAFLLVHLGGPDSITAFSLEDNALWPRHLVGLLAQVLAFCYILGKTLSGKNRLMAPTMLVFLAGVIKYGERSRSLYLASLERLKRSQDKLFLLNPSNIHPSWGHAYRFFPSLKGWVVDIMPSNAELQASRVFFLNEVDAEAALEVLTKEMSFLYDIFYTKTLAVRSVWGGISRGVADIIIGVVAIWFYFLEKQEQHKFDYRITSLLVYENFVLSSVSLFMQWRPSWKLGDISNFRISPRTVVRVPRKLRSNVMGAFDLLTYCFTEITQRGVCTFGSIAEKIGVAEIYVEIRYMSKVPLDVHLWKFVFDELKISLRNDTESLATVTREIYEARGNLALGRANCNDLMHFITDFEFDSSLLMWHIATIMCYHLDEDCSDNRKFGKTISNYMVYLMVKRPKLMSPVIGIGYDRYIDTCDDMKRRGKGINPNSMKEFREKLLALKEDDGERGERGKSVLLHSCDLARNLMGKDEKWKIISKVWAEMLWYAAGHCRAESYASVLAEGGEFISFVWLLMAHLGIGPRISVE
ncbi:hypothetical protein MLD38_010041 [Melastoma candidum]|uniref:Uncharacterized protein n=1 Tax=Melastoma candidum TaxID=119954 RepID=A0ACB9R1N3_9MYRT|nr:hypothetical protein MLD38_010041 [Melastoma candidum]